MVTEQHILEDQFRINQSKIKRLSATAVCPQRYLREEVTGEYKRETSEAMLKGQYFEYQLYKTMPKDGVIPVLPVHKKTKQPLTDQVRIDTQIQKYPLILAELGIKPARADFKAEWMVNGIAFHGTQDVLVEWQGKPYIMDLKLTQNVHNTFGSSFAWGLFDRKHPKFIHMKLDGGGVYIADYDAEAIRYGRAMDVIQAHSYMHIMRQKTKREWGFLYSVWDYKPKPEFKFIEVPYDMQANVDTLQRLDDTKHKLRVFHATGYEAIPNREECATCPILDCKVKLQPEPVQLAENSEVINAQVADFDDETTPF